MANDTNGVIYLEVDEDITSAIDKLTKSTSDKVQVVAAKRSTLFQSVINLKLMQKAAKDAGKGLVVVTSDRVATSLAGRLGVPIASQVGEAAAIPKATPLATQALADDEIDGGTVGEAAKAAGATPLSSPSAADTPLSSKSEPTPPTPLQAPLAPETKSKSKKARVPNIGRMQKRLLWGGLVVVVVAVLIFLNYYLASAQVALYAQASQVNSTFDFTADPTINQSDIGSSDLTAQQLTLSKTLTTTAQASGVKDDGSKASGNMTVYNCYDSSSLTLPAGTQFTAQDGNVFTSNSAVTVPGGGLSHGACAPGQASVTVQAAQNGSSYNENQGPYAVAGQPGGSSGVYAQGGQMQGGVTKIDKVVTQTDVNSAQAAALAADKAGSTAALTAKANNQQSVITQSLQQTVESSSANPTVGSVASSATVTIQVTYSELAVQKSELSKLAQAQESQQLGAQSQIYDDGSGNLQLTALSSPDSNGAQKFRAAATAYAGTKINTAALAKQLKGQKYGDAVNQAGQISGVTKADISISPSWNTSMPGIASHIHVTIKVSQPSG
jgi:hypothetical protein